MRAAIKRRSLLLALAALLQGAVLVGLYASAALPLWTGTEIRLQTLPVDPRSLLRGNYARLRYPISLLEGSLFDGRPLRNGEQVYVRLEADAQGIHRLHSVSLQPPDGGLFIRGRIANRQYQESTELYRVRYGIEAYFAPKERALALERQLAGGAVAVVMVADHGAARLKQVIPEPQ